MLVLLVAVAAVAWYVASHRAPGAEQITVYYTKEDGASEIPWTISVRPRAAGESDADRLQYLVLYAASQAVTGPPPSAPALRFPPGTRVLSASVDGSIASVDLSSEVSQPGGALNESGAFKSLVWTLTALPGIDRVAVRVAGKKVGALPGGLELDEPLRRSDW